MSRGIALHQLEMHRAIITSKTCTQANLSSKQLESTAHASRSNNEHTSARGRLLENKGIVFIDKDGIIIDDYKNPDHDTEGSKNI